MAYRVVFIENEVQIRLKLNNIVINTQNGELWVPISDVSMIVIDNPSTSISMRMLSVLAENNIGVIVCNQKHMPMGFYSSYDNHSRVSKVIRFQLNKKETFYEELWKHIVIVKIKNQRLVLKKLRMDQESIEKLSAFQNGVESGDYSNREAHSAKVYFNTLMDSTYSRGNDNILLNSGLDFGYAIIRSFIARCCVGYGLNTQIGVHHCSEYNRFNLVDDLMEPLRPFVDYYAYQLLENQEFFKPEHRHALVNILNHHVQYKQKEMYMSSMIEDYVSQYASLIMGKIERIKFPSIERYLE